MRYIKVILIVSLFSITLGCTYRGYQKKGTVEKSEFYYSTEFTTLKSLLVIPVDINGEIKNFLFDTGADATVIQRDTLLGKTTKIGGASNRKMTFGKEIVESMKIGTVNFQNTFAWNTDLVGLKEQVTDFGGLIGQPIISKANVSCPKRL